MFCPDHLHSRTDCSPGMGLVYLGFVNVSPPVPGIDIHFSFGQLP